MSRAMYGSVLNDNLSPHKEGGYFTGATPSQGQWCRPKLGAFVCIGVVVVTAAFLASTNQHIIPPAWSSSSSGSSSSSSSSVVSSLDDIDGGDWTVVRCVSSSEGTWHPATDKLAGTDVYGTYNSTFTTNPETFSTSWDPDDYSQILLGYSDLSFWLMADMSTVFTIGSDFPAPILKSSKSDTPYTALWYNREGKEEDPWASVNDHDDDDPGMVYGGQSKTGHMEHLGDAADGVGACVWVR